MGKRSESSRQREPETPRQAARHDRVSALAHDKGGLCWRCSPQCAWGHALGFTEVHPPCAGCAPIVALWPVEKPNGWRAVEGSASSPAAWEALSDHVAERRAFAVTSAVVDVERARASRRPVSALAGEV